MKKKDNGQNYNVENKQHNREDRPAKRDSTKWNKKARSNPRIKERRQISIGRQWNSFCRWKNLHSQQQEDSRTGTMRTL